MIHPTIGKIVYNETISHVFYYGDKISGYVKHESEISYRYFEIGSITFVLEQTTSKRKKFQQNDIVIWFKKS